jgi:hypothetical protein
MNLDGSGPFTGFMLSSGESQILNLSQINSIFIESTHSKFVFGFIMVAPDTKFAKKPSFSII